MTQVPVPPTLGLEFSPPLRQGFPSPLSSLSSSFLDTPHLSPHPPTVGPSLLLEGLACFSVLYRAYLPISLRSELMFPPPNMFPWLIGVNLPVVSHVPPLGAHPRAPPLPLHVIQDPLPLRMFIDGTMFQNPVSYPQALRAPASYVQRGPGPARTVVPSGWTAFPSINV